MAHPETDWQCALARLDQGLALTPAERGAWLAALGLEHPGAARLLSKLLEAHGRVDEENLLQGLPQLMPMPQAVEQDPGRPGLQVGPFELVELLGRGGMGSVWRARYADGRLHREVAVKLPSRSPDPAAMSLLRERLVRERNFLARLEHPHIARVYDAGLSDDGQPFLAMEYVAGQPIDRYADAERLTVQQRIRLFLQVLEAVAYAHQRLVLHRDLKPGNVLVTPQGQVRLLDFGIARALNISDGPAVRVDSPVSSHLVNHGMEADASFQAASAGDTSLTGRAGRVFTLAYAAPEQVDGAELSMATDVYSLGVMLHELLTGSPPHRPADGRPKPADASVHASPAAIPSRRQPPVEAAALRQTSASALSRMLAGDLDLILQKALAPDPAARYATAEAFSGDLRSYLERRPLAARGNGWRYRLACFISRNRLGVSAGMGVALALMVTTGWALHQARVSDQMSRVAQREASLALASQRFFTRLLSDADPARNRNGVVRPIDGALEAAERELSGTPEILVKVLKQLGDLYIRIDVPEKNLLVQKRRVALLDSLRNVSTDEAVDAHIELARAVSESTDPRERVTAADQAGKACALAVRLKASQVLLVRCLCLQADLALAQSAPEMAAEHAGRAVALAEEMHPVPEVEHSLALATLGMARSRLGQFDEARAALQQALQLDGSGHGRDVLEQLHTRATLADVEFESGRYTDSLLQAQQVIATAEKDMGPMEGTLHRSRMRVVLAALALGNPEQAARWSHELLEQDAVSDDSFRAGVAHLTQATAEIAMGRHDHAHQLLERASTELQSSALWSARVKTRQADWLLAVGHLQEVRPLLAETLERAVQDQLLEREAYRTAFERAGIAEARLGRNKGAQIDFSLACQGPRRRLETTHPDRVRCESYLLMADEDLSIPASVAALNQQLSQLQSRRLPPCALEGAIMSAMSRLNSARSKSAFIRDLPSLS